MEIEHDDIVIHKWAAIEKTHVFPVTPLVSLVLTRFGVALLLTLAAAVVIHLAG